MTAGLPPMAKRGDRDPFPRPPKNRLRLVEGGERGWGTGRYHKRLTSCLYPFFTLAEGENSIFFNFFDPYNYQ